MEKTVVTFQWDADALVWITTNDEIGLVLESESYDELINKVRNALPELLALKRY